MLLIDMFVCLFAFNKFLSPENICSYFYSVDFITLISYKTIAYIEDYIRIVHTAWVGCGIPRMVDTPRTEPLLPHTAASVPRSHQPLLLSIRI